MSHGKAAHPAFPDYKVHLKESAIHRHTFSLGVIDGSRRQWAPGSSTAFRPNGRNPLVLTGDNREKLSRKENRLLPCCRLPLWRRIRRRRCRPAADVYHVHVAADPLPARSLNSATSSRLRTRILPCPDNVLVLRHQDGAEWDYVVITHLGTKATVSASGHAHARQCPRHVRLAWRHVRKWARLAGIRPRHGSW